MYQLQQLQQKDRIVEEYRQKNRVAIRVGIREEPGITMVWFQSGLNHEI